MWSNKVFYLEIFCIAMSFWNLFLINIWKNMLKVLKKTWNSWIKKFKHKPCEAKGGLIKKKTNPNSKIKLEGMFKSQCETNMIHNPILRMIILVWKF